VDTTRSIDSLLQATAKADRQAFRALYDAYAPKLFGISMRICGERLLAEDALQETFSEIWHKADQFDPSRGRGEAWIAVIARNRAIDVIRRRSRDSFVAPDDIWSTVAIADPSQLSDGGVEYMTLVKCLEELEDKQREAVLLAYYEGASREELAGHFHAPVNTVKTWLRRSLAALRSCLDR
jgi:RNA polymerase sigma-70 factor, ECF subfamily